MKNIGVIGIGDMGSGLAKNLIANGFEVRGYDLKPDRMSAFTTMGGIACTSAAEVGADSEAVFVMVMTGDEARQVIFGDEEYAGLQGHLHQGGVIIMTATIKPVDVRDIANRLEGTGLDLIDTPVSGGFPGAQGGTLTLMAAGTDAALEKAKGPMEAVSATIHRVGTEAGMGQTMKACLQSLIGSIFAATFEATAMAAKAGVNPDALLNVFSTSSAGSVVTNTAIENIIAGEFVGTGSHINTMYKDMTISMDLARELGVPLFTAATAMQLFQAGRTKHPDGDNWVVTKITEEIIDAKLRRYTNGPG